MVAMKEIITEIQDKILLISFNRQAKNNAFDDNILHELQRILDDANQNNAIRVIVLKGNGKHFSAGADLNWMKRMANFSEQENIDDAKTLARVMHSLYKSPKPTIAMVQGAAIGGGAGIVAACDIAIAGKDAKFAFPEVKLGLIPAVISPYVIKAIGPRVANSLFLTAETIDAQRALELNLITHCCLEEDLLSYTLKIAKLVASYAPKAKTMCKNLVGSVMYEEINEALLDKTAELIAKARIAEEGQRGLQGFLNKEIVKWD